METGTKVLIGAAAALAIGGGIYWFFIREGEAVAGKVKEEGAGRTAGGSVPMGGGGGGYMPPPRYGNPNPSTPPPAKTPVASSVTMKIPTPAIVTPTTPKRASVGADGSRSWSNATGYIC